LNTGGDGVIVSQAMDISSYCSTNDGRMDWAM